MEHIELNRIRRDGDTQCRAGGTDAKTVQNYAERMRAGDQFPSITVYDDGSVYWLADGFHRVEAAVLAGYTTIPAEVRPGTQRDAMIFGAAANAQHGRPLTARDRQKIVIRLLRDEEVKKWSDRAIARHVGCSAVTVGKYRSLVQNEHVTGRGVEYLEESAEVPAIPIYPSDNMLGIPRLDIEYQATELLLPAVKWGTQARSAPISGTAHFYTHDYKFAGVWSKPHQLVNAKAGAVIEVNYSTYASQPRAVAIGDMYRKRHLSRYWGLNGVKIFVDLFVENVFFDLALMGVPKGWRAYANRAFSDSLDHLTEAYKVAAKRAGTWDILYVVYGGHDRIRTICDKRGWLWIPEDSGVKRGSKQRKQTEAAQ